MNLGREAIKLHYKLVDTLIIFHVEVGKLALGICGGVVRPEG